MINDLNSIEISGFNNLIDESTKELKSDIGTNDQELTLFMNQDILGSLQLKLYLEAVLDQRLLRAAKNLSHYK